MEKYRFATQQNDGTWLSHEFHCPDDDDAVAFGLLHRTAKSCELFCGDRHLASFDSAPVTEPRNAAGKSASPRLEIIS